MERKPLGVELFAGTAHLSGIFARRGWRMVAFDLERLPHHGPVPEGVEFVRQNVLTMHGSQFRNADFIWASPPCQNYSYLAMPWSRSPDWVEPEGDGWRILNSARAKAMLERWLREGPDNRLFDACFRIQREACEAAGRHIPMVVENVRGAQRWVGRSAWNFGSFHLWGDVPALMPIAAQMDGTKIGGGWFSNPNSPCRKYGSRSKARKAASALIARIPDALAEHLAEVFYPKRF